MKISSCKMEETKNFENHENFPAVNMKAPNAHGEIKEIISHEPSDKDKVLKTEPGIPSAEKNPEAKKVIFTEAVTNTTNQEQTLNETLPVETHNMEQNHIQPKKERPNPKENSTETSETSQAPAKEQSAAEESTAEKDKPSKLKAKLPIEDHQETETTKADQQDESKDAPQAVQEKKDKSKKSKSSEAKKPENIEDQTKTPEVKMDVEEQESYRQSSAKEIQMEQDSRKTWRSLLTEVSLVSSLSTFKLLYDKSSTSESSDASVRKRTAKQLYKKKMQILRENYTYRLGLLKQLKEGMRDKYNSEAQQLYTDYTSSKRKHKLQKTPSIHAEDSQESKVTDPGEDPVALSTLG